MSFCEALFPYLVLSLLWNQEEVYRPIISRHFQSFFSSAANSPSSPSPSSSFSSPQSSLRLSLTPPPPSVSTTIMLNTVMFLRTIDRPNLRKRLASYMYGQEYNRRGIYAFYCLCTVLCGTTTFGWILTSSMLPWQHNDAPPTLHPSSTSKYGTEQNGTKRLHIRCCVCLYWLP